MQIDDHAALQWLALHALVSSGASREYPEAEDVEGRLLYRNPDTEPQGAVDIGGSELERVCALLDGRLEGRERRLVLERLVLEPDLYAVLLDLDAGNDATVAQS